MDGVVGSTYLYPDVYIGMPKSIFLFSLLAIGIRS